jgi:hypothetical protein
MDWVVFYNPTAEINQTDGRIKRWEFIDEVQKYLRIIILDDKETIHNAFFDRNFKN